jgi:hypothetical protein
MNVSPRETSIQNRSTTIASLPIPVDKMSIVKGSDNHTLAVGGVDARRVAGETAIRVTSC